MPFSKINNLIQGNNGCHELIIAENALQGLVVQHSPVIEYVSPGGPVNIVYEPLILIGKQKHAFAVRTRVEQVSYIQLGLASQTFVNHLAVRCGNQIGPDLFGELIQFHDAFLSMALSKGLMPWQKGPFRFS